MENAAYYFAETVFIGESTAGESRHVLNGIVLAGEGNIMYNIYTHIYIYVYHYIYTLDPLWFPVSQLRPFGFLPSFHPVETAHCALCRKQKWCWKLLTQRKQMYQFMKCRSRRQQCGNVFKDLNLRMSQGGGNICIYNCNIYIYIAWYILSYHF